MMAAYLCPIAAGEAKWTHPGTAGRETDPEWDKEIGEDVKNECSKFGIVVHHYVDRNSQVCCQLSTSPLL